MSAGGSGASERREGGRKSPAEEAALFDPRQRRRRHGWDGPLVPVDRVFDSMLEDFWDRRFPNFGRFGALSRDVEDGFLHDVVHGRGFTTDVVERDDHYEMEIEVPGVPKESIEIKVSDGQLKIKAERKEEKKQEEDGKVVRSERSYGRFERNYTLPRNADPAAIKAKNENGVLTINIPKKAGEAIEDAHEIPVE